MRLRPVFPQLDTGVATQTLRQPSTALLDCDVATRLMQLDGDEHRDGHDRHDNEWELVHRHLAAGLVARLATADVVRGRLVREALERTAVLARAEDAVPHTAHRREGVVAPFVTLMVPVVMVRHLRPRQPLLHRVRQVEAARDA